MPRVFRSAVRRTVLFLAVALASGCSSDSPSTPGGGGGGPAGLDTGRRVARTIGAGGGELETVAADGTVFRLIVPPGAVTAPTAFAITPWTTAPGADSLGPIQPGLYLEPAGARFDLPVTAQVTLPTPPTPGDHPALVVAGEAGTHDVILATELSGATMTASLSHFSSIVPANPTEQQLALLWNTVVLEIQTYGESIERVETLVSIYLYAQSAGFSTIPVLPDWPDTIHHALAGLITAGAAACATGNCADGRHILFHARNQAAAMLFADLDARADSAEANCNQPWMTMDLTYPRGCGAIQPGDPVDVMVEVMTPGRGPASGVDVQLSLDGTGSLTFTRGTTDSLGRFASTYLAGAGNLQVADVIHATMPGACNPSAEVTRAVTPFGVGDTTQALIFRLTSMYVASAVCCGPGDNERSKVILIEGTCAPAIGPGGSIDQSSEAQAAWGSSSTRGTISLETNAFSVSGGIDPSTVGSSGDVSVRGVLVYRNPAGQAFGPNAVLHVTTTWSHASIDGGFVAGSTGRLPILSGSAGTATGDYPLTEGATEVVIQVDGFAAGGGATLSLECRNCP